MQGRQLLSTFLENSKLSPADFARVSRGRVNEPELSRWLRGVGRPGLRKAIALEDLTLGEVPAKSWVDGKTGKRRSTSKAA